MTLLAPVLMTLLAPNPFEQGQRPCHKLMMTNMLALWHVNFVTDVLQLEMQLVRGIYVYIYVTLVC